MTYTITIYEDKAIIWDDEASKVERIIHNVLGAELRNNECKALIFDGIVYNVKKYRISEIPKDILDIPCELKWILHVEV